MEKRLFFLNNLKNKIIKASQSQLYLKIRQIFLFVESSNNQKSDIVSYSSKNLKYGKRTKNYYLEIKNNFKDLKKEIIFYFLRKNGELNLLN